MSTADITRDMVIAAANGLRVVEPTDAATTALETALRSIVTHGAGMTAGEGIERVIAYPANTGDDADGVLIDAWIRSSGLVRSCTITAVAVNDPAFTLTGSVALKGAPVDSDAAPTILRSSPLSGAVFATEPIDTASYGVLSVDASGAAAGASSGTTTQQVPDPKSPAQRKAAKKTYDQQVTAAKKVYAKAVKKAGRSKRKKKAAKRAFAARKAAAKAQYAAALVDHRVVTVPVAGTESRPFALTMSTDFVD